jgi:hypothetical protein
MSAKIPTAEKQRLNVIDERLAEIDKLFIAHETSGTLLDQSKYTLLRKEALRLIAERELMLRNSGKE